MYKLKFTSQKVPFSNPYIEIEIYTSIDNKKKVFVLLDKWYYEVQFFLNKEHDHPIEIARYHFESLTEASIFFNSFSIGSKNINFIINKHSTSYNSNSIVIKPNAQ